MAISDLLRNVAAQFGEMMKTRQEKYGGSIEEARQRLQESALSSREAQQALIQSSAELSQARRSAGALGQRRQILIRVKRGLQRARNQLQYARVANLPRARIRQFEEAEREARQRVVNAQGLVQESAQAGVSIPRLEETVERRQIDVTSSTRTEESTRRQLDEITSRSGSAGAAREGFDQISFGAGQAGRRGSEFGGAGNIVQGIGTVASAIPGIGGAVATGLNLAGSLMKATEALTKWTRSVIDSDTVLGTISPAMAVTALRERMREMHRQFTEGQLLAPATERLSQAQDRLFQSTIEERMTIARGIRGAAAVAEDAATIIANPRQLGRASITGTAAASVQAREEIRNFDISNNYYNLPVNIAQSLVRIFSEGVRGAAIASEKETTKEQTQRGVPRLPTAARDWPSSVQRPERFGNN